MSTQTQIRRKRKRKQGIEENEKEACRMFSLLRGWKIHLKSSELEGKQFCLKQRPSPNPFSYSNSMNARPGGLRFMLS